MAHRRTMSGLRECAAAVSGAALLLSLIASSACVWTSAASGCDSACADQATIDLQSATGGWTAGTYALDLNADGVASNCTIQAPSAPSASTSILGSCTTTTGAELTFSSVSQCGSLTSSDGRAKGGYCAPVSGQFHMTLSLGGLTLAKMPKNLALTLSRDGVPVDSKMFALTYQAFQVCETSCYSASAQWMIAEGGATSGDAGGGSGGASDGAE